MLTADDLRNGSKRHILVTYLSRTSCSTGVTKDHARSSVSPSSFLCASVLAGAHAGFLLTQSFFQTSRGVDFLRLYFLL